MLLAAFIQASLSTSFSAEARFREDVCKLPCLLGGAHKAGHQRTTRYTHLGGLTSMRIRAKTIGRQKEWVSHLLRRACKVAASGSVSAIPCVWGDSARPALNSRIFRSTASMFSGASNRRKAVAGTCRAAGAARCAADAPGLGQSGGLSGSHTQLHSPTAAHKHLVEAHGEILLSSICTCRIVGTLSHHSLTH